MQDQNNPLPLDMDLASVDTSLPLLAKNKYQLRVNKAEAKPTKAAGGLMAALELRTVDPATSIKGDPLGPGIVVFHNLNLKPTGKATWDMVIRNIASLVQAAGLTGITVSTVQSGDTSWIKQLEGRVVTANVDYVPEGVNPQTGQTYRAKNEVTAFYKS